jgi:abortive infection bacteriophage resistance protein
MENISYYRFSSYWHPLLDDRQNYVFRPNIRFETVFDLYKFDRELRKLIIAELEKIEVAVRSRTAYLMSLAHGVFWIGDETLFSCTAIHQATLAKIGDELSRSNDDMILSFQAAYSNPLPPSYMLLEITSFGTLLRLYNNLKPGRMKKDIAATFGLSDSVFASWLHSLVSIRNVCAYHERLWNRQLRIQPLFPRTCGHTWIVGKDVSNRRIFYALSMILYLLNVVNPGHTFKEKSENIFLKYPNVDVRAMGFPAAWRDEPLWQQHINQ